MEATLFTPTRGKGVTETQRALNIFTKAIDYGFEFDHDDSMEVNLNAAIDLLIDNDSELQEEY